MARATVMTIEAQAPHRWPRLARLIIGRNELRRPSDRIEGAVLVALSAAFLAVAVMAVFLAAHVYQSQRAFAAALRPAVAVLSKPGPVLYNTEPAAQVQASWVLSNGTERSGFLTTGIAPAIYGAPAGTSVWVWLDRSGEPQLPPAGRREIVVSALIAGILLTYALAMYINIKRGRLLLDCGCSWGSRRQPVHIWLVARNAGLALVAVLLAPPVADRALSIIDCVSVVASLIVAAFLYAGTNQLLSIQSNVREAG